MFFFCCCITSPATAGRWGRCRGTCRRSTGRGVPALRRRLPPLPVQYADYTLWQQAVLGAEDDADSAIARQLSFWTGGTAGSAGAARAAGRPAAAGGGEPSRRHVPLRIDAELHRGLAGLARGAGASLFMVLQAGLAALLTRLGAGSDIAIGSPIAGRTDARAGRSDRVLRQHAGAAHRHLGQPELPGADRPGAGRQPCGLWPCRAAVRAAGGGAQSGAVAVAAPAVPGDAGVRGGGGGGGAFAARACAFAASAEHGERQVRPVAGAGRAARGRRRAGRHRGRAGIRKRPVRRRQRGGAGGAADPAAGGRGRRSGAGAGRPGDPRRRPSATPSCGCGTTPPLGGGCGRLPATLPALFAAQAARTPDAVGGHLRGPHAELRRARGPRQPAGASSAKASASGPRPWSGCAWSARRRWWWGCSASSRPAAPICRSIRITRASGWRSCWPTPARRCW